MANTNPSSSSVKQSDDTSKSTNNDVKPTSSELTTSSVEVKYPVEDLIENSKALTGYGKEVAVGALFNCKEKELAKDDFKKAIKDFLGKRVE